MTIFKLKKKLFIFLAGLLLGMAVLQMFQRKQKKDLLSNSSFFLFSKIQVLSANFQNNLSDLVKKYFFLLHLNEINKKLQSQNKELQSQNQLFEETRKENERLRKLLRFPLNKEFILLPAQVVGTDLLSKNELLTINKGSRQGLKRFMGVLHPQGVVGYVFRVNSHSAQVLSLLSPLSSLPSRNSRNRATGLLEAYKTNLLIFNYLDGPAWSKPKIGDQIVTIRSDQFPPGFPVGVVSSLESSSKNLHPAIYVKPAVPFYSLEEVFVVLDPKSSAGQKQDVKETKPFLKKIRENDEDKN